MRIVEDPNTKKVRIVDVPKGDVFKSEGEFYLKVNCTNIQDSEINAISLASGMAFVFVDSEKLVEHIPNTVLIV